MATSYTVVVTASLRISCSFDTICEYRTGFLLNNMHLNFENNGLCLNIIAIFLTEMFIYIELLKWY